MKHIINWIASRKKVSLFNKNKKDIVIGCIANYGIDKIKNWVFSINSSGFCGDKVVINYNLDEKVLLFLKDNGFKYYNYGLSDSHIFVQRFLDMWHLLSQLDLSKYRYVIATDVKDVVFQTNPSKWLEKNLKNKKILVSSECLRFEDEVWGNEILKSSYSHLYDYFNKNIIYNAGTVAGEVNTMKDFFLNLYHFSLSANDEESDQPALNILINLEHIRPLVKFANQEEGWCAQLGTVMAPKVIEKYRSHLTEPAPTIDENGLVVNSNKVPFALVHQYDRVSQLRNIMKKRYS